MECAEQMSDVDFWTFYKTTFLAEHQHPWNASFHVAGTVLGWATIPVVLLLQTSLWYLLLSPVLMIVPGLIGHRLWERNQAVGDLRVFRGDFPGLWFLLGNHVMTYHFLAGAHKPYEGTKS